MSKIREIHPKWYGQIERRYKCFVTRQKRINQDSGARKGREFFTVRNKKNLNNIDLTSAIVSA